MLGIALDKLGIDKFIKGVKVHKTTGSDAISERIMKDCFLDVDKMLLKNFRKTQILTEFLVIDIRQMSSLYSRKVSDQTIQIIAKFHLQVMSASNQYIFLSVTCQISLKIQHLRDKYHSFVVRDHMALNMI